MKFTSPRRLLVLGACAATAVAGITVVGVEQASAAPGTTLDIVLGVGSDQSEKVVSWYYSNSAEAQGLQLQEAPTAAGVTAFDASSRTISATSAPNTVVDSQTFTKPLELDGTPSTTTQQSGYSNNHVDLGDLKPNTYYSYRVGAISALDSSKTYTFFTGSADQGSFVFDAFGDPQIGSSGYTHNDGRGWGKTLEYIKAQPVQPELLVSTGDQVEAANNEYQWSNFADPDVSGAGDGSQISSVLKEYTYAPQIGNHEGAYSEPSGPAGTTPAPTTISTGRAYMQHFFPPNDNLDARFFRTTATGSATELADASTASRPGGDYWYVYKNVLFVNINSNAYSGTADPAHEAYIKDVVAQHGAGTKWQIVTFHHSVYSPADHANDADNSVRRKDLPATLSAAGIDLVIQGHDHAYSRSYELKSEATGTQPSKVNAAEQPGAQAVVTGPGGVVYLTVDSSSGSKYYDLTIPDTTKNGGDYPADPLDSAFNKNDANQARHFANSVESQQYVPTYVQVTVSPTALSVKNVATLDYTAEQNSAVKTKKAGQRINPTVTPARPYTDDELAALGDQRNPLPAAASGNPHWLQTPGAVSDLFSLSGGNTNASPAPATPTVTATATATTTVTVPAPGTSTCSPGGLTYLQAKVVKLVKKVKRAHGANKARLQGKLSAFKNALSHTKC